jgi:hypothetical protein
LFPLWWQCYARQNRRAILYPLPRLTQPSGATFAITRDCSSESLVVVSSRLGGDPAAALALGFSLLKSLQTLSRIFSKYAVTTAAREACGLLLRQLNLSERWGHESHERPMSIMLTYHPFAAGIGALLAAAFVFPLFRLQLALMIRGSWLPRSFSRPLGAVTYSSGRS